MSPSNKPARRRRPIQARSRQTVEDLLEGATRVFRREGWGATTNRIAEATGVSVGTLYEYFPNKEALLLELAERHVALAERGIGEALSGDPTTFELLGRLQAAIVDSQRFPSEALDLIQNGDTAGPELVARAEALRERVLRALVDRASDLDEPELRAQAAFDAIGILSVAAALRAGIPSEAEPLLRHYLAMAANRFDVR